MHVFLILCMSQCRYECMYVCMYICIITSIGDVTSLLERKAEERICLVDCLRRMRELYTFPEEINVIGHARSCLEEWFSYLQDTAASDVFLVSLGGNYV